MSTLLSSPASLPSWKQEVNRRLAEHKNRKGISVVDQDDSTEQQGSGNSRAAAAAARVAARYAKVPSYSELQAVEARVALRAAEVATRAAVEAQVAAQAVLDQMQRVEEETEQPEVQHAYEPAAPRWQWDDAPQSDAAGSGNVEIRWEPDLPQLPAQQEMRASNYGAWQVAEAHEYEPGLIYEAVEAAQPIAANLIEFPREIIATRRMRPRLADGPAAGEESEQLSIFEVDPNMVSTEPMGQAVADVSESTWTGSSWQEIQLDAQPHGESLPDYYALVPDEHKLYQAPFGRRMMAAMVDAAVIVGLVCGVSYLIASNVDTLPGKRVFEVCGVLAVLGFAALYEWFFLTYARVTPGMRYAQLSICTFDEQAPTKAQIKGRLKAMLISVLPVGLGMLWSVFDEDQMSWHDRLSKTYLRLS